MPTNKIDVAMRTLAGATLLVALLSGCGTSAEPEAVPPPPAAAAPAATLPAPSTDAAAAQPAPAASPATEAPTEPVAAPTPVTHNEPRLESMSVATTSAKISVPVDLRFQFDGAVLPDQPVILHLAAVSRVAGTHLAVSVKPVAGLRVDAAPMAVEKVSAAGIYRQQLSITTSAGAPSALRVLVTMDMAEGSGFGFFTVPLASETAAKPQKSVKQP